MAMKNWKVIMSNAKNKAIEENVKTIVYFNGKSFLYTTDENYKSGKYRPYKIFLAGTGEEIDVYNN